MNGNERISSRAAVRLLPTLLLLPALACGGDGAGGGKGEWAGTMRDSAGVTYVENTADGLWQADENWTLDQQLDIGAVEGSPDYQFGQIVAIDVDDAGNIYVLDQQAQQVAVYDAQGKFARRIGKPGSGPGELSPQTGGVLIMDDAVVVPDPGAQRVSLFSPAGEFQRSWRLDMTGGIPIKWERRGGDLLAQVRSLGMGVGQISETEPIVVYGDSGVVSDTVAMLPRGKSMEITENGPRFLLFATEPLWTVLPDGRVASGINDAVRIEVRSEDGTVQRVVSLPRDVVAIDDAKKQRVLDLMKKMLTSRGTPPQLIDRLVGSMKVADRYPSYASMLGGPDRTLWVQQIDPIVSADDVAESEGNVTEDIQDIGSSSWDVFDPDGRYLGVVKMPDHFQALRFVGDALYGVWRDDLDVQHVLRLHLDRGAQPSNA